MSFSIDAIRKRIDGIKPIHVTNFLGRVITVILANKIPAFIAISILNASPFYVVVAIITLSSVIFCAYNKNQGPVPSPLYDDSLELLDLAKVVSLLGSGIIFGSIITDLPPTVIAVIVAVTGIFYARNLSHANPTPAPIYGDLVRPENPKNIFFEKEVVSDIVVQIFNKLDYKELGYCCQVSHAWNKLANDPFLSKKIVFQTFAFNPMHWNMVFDEDIVAEKEMEEAFKLLPNNIYAILKSPSKAFPGKKIIDKHVLVWIPTIKNEEPTLNNFGMLIKQKDEFSQNSTGSGYRYFDRFTQDQDGDKSIESGWRLMAIDNLRNSQNKEYHPQKNMVDSLNGNYQTGWRIPKVGEVIVCSHAHYFRSGKRLFGDYPTTFTHCQDTVDRFYKTVVGDFSLNGIHIRSHSLSLYQDSLGVTAIWQL